MQTPLCQLLAYCETTGGPVCICASDAAAQWRGSEQPDSLYWDVTAKMGTATLFRYTEDYQFFGTETGNFVFFRGADTLIVAEIISIEETAIIPWQGLEFNIIPNTRSAVSLSGFICFFDAAISIPQPITTHEAIYTVEQNGTWNAATLFCGYQQVCEIEFLSAGMHLTGLAFLAEAY